MEKRKDFGEIILVSLFFCAVAFFFSRPLFLVTDLWWHLASGRWIAENMALPQIDPFSLLPGAELSLRQAMTIKGFWLAQVLFYAVYAVVGVPGLVALKSLLLTLIVFVTWKIVINRGVSSIPGLLLVSPVAIYLREYDELRPQMFSFLFAAITILLMERIVRSLKQGGEVSRSCFLCVCAVLLVWANVHPGFVVGVGIVTTYSAVLLLLHCFGKLAVSGSGLRVLCAGSFCVAIAAIINPNNIAVYRLLLTEGAGGRFAATVSEYDNVFKYFYDKGDPYLFYGMVLIAISAVLAIVSTRNITDICLLIIFGVAGFMSFRYAAFFVIISAVVMGDGLSAVSSRIKGNVFAGCRALVVVISLSLVVFTKNATAFSVGATALGGVDDLVGFVKGKELPGPLFAPYDWGGYLQWTLYPEYKVFVDQRCLNYERYSEYRNVILGKKHEVFDKYKFKTVVFYLNPPTARQIPGLVFSLLGDDEWKIVYDNGSSLVFTRNGSSHIDKQAYINHLEQALINESNADSMKIGPVLDLGQLYYVKHDYDNARRFFSTALKLDPENSFAKSWLDYLDSSRIK